MSQRVTFLALAIWGACTSQLAEAHTRIKPGQTLIPRSTSSAEKTGPCGSTPATTDPMLRTTLTGGQTLKVYWEETINHTSHFRIAFSSDGSTGFDSNVLLDNIVDNQSGATDYSNPATYHQFNATITIPNTACESCSIQVIQVMLDNPMTPTNYYSCADVRIVVAASPTVPSPIATTPTPATPMPPAAIPVPSSPTPALPAGPTNLKVILKPAGP